MPRGCTIDLVRERIQRALQRIEIEGGEIVTELDHADWQLILSALGVAEMSRDLILRLDAMVETREEAADGAADGADHGADGEFRIESDTIG